MIPIWVYSLIVSLLGLLLAAYTQLWYQREYRRKLDADIQARANQLREFDFSGSDINAYYLPYNHEAPPNWKKHLDWVLKVGKTVGYIFGALGGFFAVVNGAFDFYRNITGKK